MSFLVRCVLTLAVLTGYHCIATTRADERFRTEPTDEVAYIGELVVLRCAIENRVGQVQWIRDGFGLGVGPTFDGYPRYSVDEESASGTYNLVISNAQLEDDASFQCQVGATETTFGLRSRVATLTVHVPPSSVSIDGSPEVGALLEAASELICRVVGSRPAASTIWRRNDVIVSGAETEAKPGEGKLSDTVSRLIVNVQRDDQGAVYSCQAEHNVSQRNFLTAEIRLNVLYAPNVTLKKATDENIKEFDRIVFTCSADGNPPVSEWKWFKDDDVISGESNSNLVIDRIDRSYHGRTIGCLATNKVASARASTVVQLRYGPKFINSLSELTSDPGAIQVVLSCHADSNPEARYAWSREGVPLPVLSRDPTLVISPVARESFGTYTCTSSAEGYQSISRTVSLLMNGRAQIISSSEQSAAAAGTATMECLVSAIPRPHYIAWTRDGTPINTIERYRVAEREIHHGRASVLVINDVQDSDFGRFNCTTDNGYGLVYLEITLSKKAVIPLSYILAALIGAVAIAAIIAVIVIVVRRRRNRDSEVVVLRCGSGRRKFGLMPIIFIYHEIASDSSECRMTRGKKDFVNIHDSRIGSYSLKAGAELHDEMVDSFPGDDCVGAWTTTERFNGRPVTNLTRDQYYPCNSWSCRDSHRPQSPGNHSEHISWPHSTTFGDGVYDVSDAPRSIDHFRDSNVYWPENYGSMRPSRRDVTTPYDFRPIMTSSSPMPVDYSELATNV